MVRVPILIALCLCCLSTANTTKAVEEKKIQPEGSMHHKIEEVYLKHIREKVLQIGPLCNLIFVGDGALASLFKSDMNRTGDIERTYAALNFAMPGDTVETLQHRFSVPTEYKGIKESAKVIFYAGTSDMIVGRSAKDIGTHSMELVKQIKKLFPKSKIAIHGLLHYSKPGLQKVSDDVNELLKGYTTKVKDPMIEYIDSQALWHEITSNPAKDISNLNISLADDGAACFSEALLKKECNPLLWKVLEVAMKSVPEINRPLPPPVKLHHHERKIATHEPISTTFEKTPVADDEVGRVDVNPSKKNAEGSPKKSPK